VCWWVTEWLRARKDAEIVALVPHPLERSRFRDEIVDAAGLPYERVLAPSDLETAEGIRKLRAFGVELGISIYFGYILRRPLLTAFRRGCVNLHPALLPYNRGSFPNVWSIVENTPAGATLHEVDEGIDTGDILAQREVPVEPVDTGETLYHRLERACFELFVDSWEPLLEHRLVPVPQQSTGTYHLKRDIARIDAIDLDRPTTARQVIDLLRARSFRRYTGAYFATAEGRRVYLFLKLAYDASPE
jgi:methionyl-tRNA formyltransferase